MIRASKESFKNRLVAEVQNSALTKVEMAIRLKVSRSQLDKYLDGKSAPTLDVAERISRYFGMSLGEFLGDIPADHDIMGCVTRIRGPILELPSAGLASSDQAAAPARKPTPQEITWAIESVLSEPNGLEALTMVVNRISDELAKRKA